jgi:hypothetical protein
MTAVETQKTTETLRLPRVFSASILPLRNFCLCTSSLSFNKLLTPSPTFNNLLVAFKSDYSSW